MTELAASPDEDFETLLDFLKRNRGFDFTGYKRASLRRRVDKRMQEVGASDYASYLTQLEEEPGEFTQLFNTLLINVTRFFRDETPWEYLRDEAIPALLARKPGSTPIRVWSAGCASGEEAYTLAILFAEALGPDAFRDRVKIYATDVDDEALTTARAAVYTEKQIQDVPDGLREKYFDRGETRSIFTKELRRAVIFGRNDLVQDAPISRIDLLVCRNCLMYFNAPTQAAILARFHFALAENGVLLLGRAETLLTHTNAFAPLDIKRRIFTKVPRLPLRDRMSMSSQSAQMDGGSPSIVSRLRDSAFDGGAEAQLVVDRDGKLSMANARARSLFALVSGDFGRPLQDLELSYRPVELRSLFEQSYAEQRTVSVRDVVWRPRSIGDDRTMSIDVAPLADGHGGPLGVSVMFTDVTEASRLQVQLEESRQGLETAYEELQSTNEELETTNEELQSTVEELETTNEELQSTNEELETMNEELHSTNAELQTINDELGQRTDELNGLNQFLESVFTSLGGGIVVLNSELRVLVWNALSEELWGVRRAEVIDTQFLTLDIGLPVKELSSHILNVLSGAASSAAVTLDATNRRGRAMRCEVRCSPLLEGDGRISGVMLMMEPVD